MEHKYVPKEIPGSSVTQIIIRELTKADADIGGLQIFYSLMELGTSGVYNNISRRRIMWIF
jgi:hypothetical protein